MSTTEEKSEILKKTSLINQKRRRGLKKSKKKPQMLILKTEEIQEESQMATKDDTRTEIREQVIRPEKEQEDTIESMSPNEILVRRAIEILGSNDDNSITTFLFELSSQLSIANERLIETQRCSELLKVLINQLDKLYLPEIPMQALLCIHYILDIYSGFVITLIRNDGISKIIELTQNIEYIDLAENAIKLLEVISQETPRELIRYNTFCSVLMFVDFFDINLRKTVSKICLNLTNYIRNGETLKDYILPGIESLSNMVKICGNNDMEKNIMDNSINSFFNIFKSLNSLEINEESENIIQSIISSKILENLVEIINQMALMDEKTIRTNHLNESLKQIIKILCLVLKLHQDSCSMLLNMNILIHIHKILEVQFKLNNNFAYNSNTLLIEILNFITLLFPAKNSGKIEKILIESNKDHIYFLSENIISFLVSLVVNISSTPITSKVLNLLTIYLSLVDSDISKRTINPRILSNLMSKLLDTMEADYILEIIELTEICLTKLPTIFISSFIREGVMFYIEKLCTVQKNDIIINDHLILMDRARNINNEIYNESIEELVNEYQKSNTNNQKDVLTLQENQVNDESSDEDDDDEEAEDVNHNVKIESNNEDSNRLTTENINLQINSENVESQITRDKIIKKISSTEVLLLTIRKYTFKIVNQYFDREKLSILFMENNIEDPFLIQNKLKLLSEKFIQSGPKFSPQLITEFFQLINDYQDITFYEINTSEIFLHLVNNIEPFFNKNFEERKTFSNLSYSFDIFEKTKLIIESLNSSQLEKFLSLLNYCVSSMNCFELQLEDKSSYRFASNISFKLVMRSSLSSKYSFEYEVNQAQFDENGLDIIYSDLHSYYEENKKLNIYVDSLESFNSIEQKILNKKLADLNQNNRVDDIDFTTKKFHDFISMITMRKSSEDIQQTEAILVQLLERKNSINSNFDADSEMNSNNVTLEAMKEEMHNLKQRRKNFFVRFYINNKGVQFNISKKWNFQTLMNEYKKFCGKHSLEFSQMNIQIKYEIFVKDNNESKKIENMEIEDLILKSKHNNNIEETLFTVWYRDLIATNNSLYTVAKASPYFFLLGLFNLSLNNYFAKLFNVNHIINKQYYINEKMSSLLARQSKDLHAISYGLTPLWCKDYVSNFPFLTSFNSRFVYFKTNSFDIKRSISNLYILLKHTTNENMNEDKTLSNLRRKKFSIDRSNILISIEKLMKDYASYKGYLEFEFFDEVGSGNGPTLEFYALAFNEFKSNKDIWLRTSNNTMFPLPTLDENKIAMFHKFFFILGFLIARGIYDDRLIDIPLNSVFWDLVLDRPVSLNRIFEIDCHFGTVISNLVKLVQKKEQLVKENQKLTAIDLDALIKKELLYKNTELSDLGISFVLPGYSEIELIENGSEILLSHSNIELYLNSLFNMLFYNGIKSYKESFIDGFNLVFPIETLKCFLAEEICDVICGSCSEVWTNNLLTDAIIPKHGYTHESSVYKDFIDILCSFNEEDKRSFLSFVTGSPRLPLGGIKNLNPKLVLVKKNPDIANDNPDKYLPTVMTCQNYLKVPNYSSKEILKERILYAIKEGLNSFDLS